MPGQSFLRRFGDEGTRTPDIRVANAALYQLSYVPTQGPAILPARACATSAPLQMPSNTPILKTEAINVRDARAGYGSGGTVLLGCVGHSSAPPGCRRASGLRYL